MRQDDSIVVARNYVHHLVLGDYGYVGGLGTLDDALSLGADDVAFFLAEYGGTLVDPPDSALVPYPSYGPAVPYQGVLAKLWTAEEAESNMRLDLDITSARPHKVVVRNIQGCPPRLIPPLQEVVHHLVANDFRGLELHGHLRRYGLSAESVRGALVDYCDQAWKSRGSQAGSRVECVPIDMPTEAFSSANVIHTFETSGSWIADLRIRWKDNCVADDLSLRTRIQETSDDIDVQVTGIEVM
jgi:hypothetical protein